MAHNPADLWTGNPCSNCQTGKELYDGKEWWCDTCDYFNNTGPNATKRQKDTFE